MSRLEALLPQPRRLERTGEPVELPRALTIQLDDSAEAAARVLQLREALAALGIAAGGGDGTWSISLRVKQLALRRRPQGYLLSIGPRGCEVSGEDEAGLFYGLCTLLQLLELHAPGAPGHAIALPALMIEDWPDFPARGVMLDVSRDASPPWRPCSSWWICWRAGSSTSCSSTWSTPSPTAVTRRSGATPAPSPPRRSCRWTPTAASVTWSWCPTRTASGTCTAG